jgi:hypothetical protein
MRRAGDYSHVNQRGNWLFRAFDSSERYKIDFADDFTSEGWLQFDTDQDASYFGVWVNPRHLCTLTYAEGDWTLVDCPDWEHYCAEVEDCIRFYGEGRVCAVIGGDGRQTDVRQDRSVFLTPDGKPIGLAEVLRL